MQLQSLPSTSTRLADHRNIRYCCNGKHSTAECKFNWSDSFNSLRTVVAYMRHGKMEFDTCKQIAITSSSLA